MRSGGVAAIRDMVVFSWDANSSLIDGVLWQLGQTISPGNRSVVPKVSRAGEQPKSS